MSAAEKDARREAVVPRISIACRIPELLSKVKEAKATAANRYQANTLPR